MPTTVTGVNVYHAASAPPSSSQPPASSSINSDNDLDSLYGEEQLNEPSDIEEVCHWFFSSSSDFIYQQIFRSLHPLA